MARLGSRWALVGAVFLAGCAAGAASWGRYVGKWDGTVRTSVEIVQENPLVVEYCYDRRCALHAAQGTPLKMRIVFPRSAHFPGADLTLTRIGNRYQAIYRQKGWSRSAVTILKRR